MKIEKLRKIKRNTKMLGCLRELRRSYNTKTLEILFSKKYNYMLKVALYCFSFIFVNIYCLIIVVQRKILSFI